MELSTSDILIGLLGGGWAGNALFNYFTSRKKTAAETQALTSEATAKTSIIQVLEARISASEARQSLQDARIADLEQKLFSEREENSRLKNRIQQLEWTLAQNGITFNGTGGVQ